MKNGIVQGESGKKRKWIARMQTTPACETLEVLDLVPFGPAAQDTGCYALRLSTPIWRDWMPGQFVMIRPKAWGYDMLWPRPFSICRLSSHNLVIFFQVRGRGTQRMLSLKPGDAVDVWGPLGTGFACKPEIPTLMIAGGAGIAPFIGYTQYHPKPWNLWMDFGHRLPLGSYPFDSINEKIVADNHHEQCPEDRTRFIAHVE
jgi:dihydroorotate dehydrogenase electron transfer subunit